MQRNKTKQRMIKLSIIGVAVLQPSDMLAAVDMDFCTVDVARLLRTEEIDGLRDLFRGTEPAHGNVR